MKIFIKVSDIKKSKGCITSEFSYDGNISSCYTEEVAEVIKDLLEPKMKDLLDSQGESEAK